MKKFLSLFLVLTMVLSMLTLPTFAETVGDAAETPTPTTTVLVKDIAQDAETVEYEGVPYTVIRDLAGLKKIGAGGKYILAKDIDCGSSALAANTIPLDANSTDFTLEGNGHTITVKVDINAGGKGLFGQIPNKAIKIVIRNITFNVSGQLRNNSTGVLFGTASNHAESSVTFEKVIMNCNDLKYTEVFSDGVYNTSNNTWQGMRGAGLFYAKVRSAATFTDCLLTGSFTSTSNSYEMGVGGFVGLVDCNKSVNVTFTRCKAANGSFKTTDNESSCNGVFVGKVNSSTVTVEFDDCEIASDYSVQIAGGGSLKVTGSPDTTKTKTFDGMRAGGFIGSAQLANAVSFKDCRIGGDWNFTGYASGAFVGYVNVPCSFTNCTFAGNFTAATGKTSCYVGHLQTATLSFEKCSAAGTINASGIQTAAYVGCMDNPSTVSFSECTADMTLNTLNNRTSFFIGQVYSAGTATFNEIENLTAYFYKCTASGNINGTAGKWHATFIGSTGGGTLTPNIYFEQCDTSAVINATTSGASYVGGESGGTPTLTFKDCQTHATVYSNNLGGAWYAQPVNATVKWLGTNTDESTVICANGKLTKYEDANIKTTANTSANTYNATNGELAYKLAQAQAAKGIDAKYVFGQTIGKDATPVMGGATVYEFETKVGTFYSNDAKYVYTLDGAAEPQAYIQTTTPAGDPATFSTRVVIAVSDAKLDQIAKGTISVTFKSGEETVKTIEFDKNEVTSYYAVNSGDQIAAAADGYVLVAVTVTGIPTSEWTPVVENNAVTNVVVSMNILDAEGNAIPEYTL